MHLTDLLSADIRIAFALPFLAFELGKHVTSCPSQRNVVNSFSKCRGLRVSPILQSCLASCLQDEPSLAKVVSGLVLVSSR
jgi:hypothetical protein